MADLAGAVREWCPGLVSIILTTLCRTRQWCLSFFPAGSGNVRFRKGLCFLFLWPSTSYSEYSKSLHRKIAGSPVMKQGIWLHVCLCSVMSSSLDCSPHGSFVYGIFQARILKCGSPFPTPEDLPDPGIKPESPAQAIVSIMGTWSDYMITRNLFGSHIPHRCPAVFTQHLRRMPVGHVFIPSVLFFSPPSLGSSFRF